VQEELKQKASEATASQSEADAALAQRADLQAHQAAMEGELAHLKVRTRAALNSANKRTNGRSACPPRQSREARRRWTAPTGRAAAANTRLCLQGTLERTSLAASDASKQLQATQTQTRRLTAEIERLEVALSEARGAADGLHADLRTAHDGARALHEEAAQVSQPLVLLLSCASRDCPAGVPTWARQSPLRSAGACS
jgi:chromosome segregation ATPase